MRARHRHFNPKAAGAVAAYDARYISGLNDGDGVATWSSRTGSNDATQSTSGNRPKYETNEINGNPVVQFTGSSQHRLDISITVPASVTSVGVIRRATTGIVQILFGNSINQQRYTFWWDADNIIYTAWNGSNFLTFSPAQTNTGSIVVSSTKDGTTSSQVYLNGSTFRAAITPQASSGTFDRFGGTGTFSTGAVGNICLIDSFTSDALRKRLEHASAYSFKIACN